MGKGGKQDQSQKTNTAVITENHNLQDNKLGLAGSDGNSISTSEFDSKNYQTGNAGNTGTLIITDNSDQAFHDAALLSMAAVKANEENGRAAINAAVTSAAVSATAISNAASAAAGAAIKSAEASADRVAGVSGQSITEMGTLARDTAAQAAQVSKDSLSYYNVLSKEAFNMVTTNTARAEALAERSTKGALAFADNYTRDEAARNVDTLIKWGAGAAAVVAAAMVLRT